MENLRTVKKQGAFIPNNAVLRLGFEWESIMGRAKDNPTGFAREMGDLINRGDLSLRDIPDWKRFQRDLGDLQVQVHVPTATGEYRAIMASAFPALTGLLAVADINAAYEAVPTIGQELAPEEKATSTEEIIAEIVTDKPETKRVGEMQDFPKVGAGENVYLISTNRMGYQVEISQDLIDLNKIPDILSRINGIGEMAAEFVEIQRLNAACDAYGSASSAGEPYALHLNRTATSLYTTTANSPGTRTPLGTRKENNALVDYTDLNVARILLAGNRNSRGKRINIPASRMLLVVPSALVDVADRITLSDLEPGSVNEYNTWGPRGRWKPRVISSSWLDDMSTDTWYLGDFARQFVTKKLLDFEYVTLTGNTQAFLDRRCGFQARIAWNIGVGARDYAYVVQNLAVSTQPTALEY
jgi:hypothetical protein